MDGVRDMHGEESGGREERGHEEIDGVWEGMRR